MARSWREESSGQRSFRVLNWLVRWSSEVRSSLRVEERGCVSVAVWGCWGSGESTVFILTGGVEGSPKAEREF